MVQNVENQALRHRIRGRYLLEISLVFVAYVIAGKLGQATTNIRSSNLGPVWPAYGIALAAVLICGYRAWVGVAAGAFLVAYFSPVSHITALGQAASSTAAAMTGAFLLWRIVKFDRSLARLSDVLSLITVGGFGSALVSASAGVFVLSAAAHVHPYSGMGAAWLIYWLGDATGVLLVTPLFLRVGHFLQPHNRRSIKELLLLFLLLVATCFVVFGDLALIPVRLHFLAFAVMPFVIWAAIRFGLGVTALSVFIVATVAAIETALGSGPFATNSPFINAVLLDVFFLVLSVTGLSLAAVIEEREHAEQERAQIVCERAAMKERLRAAEALHESQDRLREYEKAVEGAEEMIAVVDREYRYLIANRQFRKMRDMTMEQVVGHSAREVVNAGVFDSVIKPKLDECFHGKVVRYEMKYSYPQLGERDIMVSYFPIEGPSGIDRVACIVQDITERKLADEARFRHAAIVESCDDAIVSASLDGIILTWNAGARRMFGYTEMEAVGKPVNMLVPPERPDEENKILERLRTGGRLEQFETVRVTKQGERIDVSLSVSPIKDSNGAIVGFSGIVRDITQRKKVEDALRESEERLRLAVHAGRMFAYSWDAATDVIERSGEAALILGIEKGEKATGAAVSAMTHPDDKERVEAALAKLTANNPTLEITYRIIRPDGGIRWLERNSRAYLNEQGGVKRVVGMIVDVTERKQAEHELAEASARLHLALEAGSAGGWDYNFKTGKNVWFGTAHAQLGMTPSETLGSRQEFADRVHQDDLENLRHAIKVAEEKHEEFTADFRVVWRDGTVHWLRSRGRFLYAENGETERSLGISLDITERKRAEEELSEMARKLVDAQEQERTRIARELHDDFTQRLALLAVGLEQLRDDPLEVPTRSEELRKQASELSVDIQNLSHELHSSQLEYLGAVAGLKSLCKEFGKRYKMEVSFRSSGPLSVIPHEIGLCLFRVAQEALHNTAKHSGLSHIEVELTGDLGEIRLTIKDFGKGFDLEAARQGQGLGLTSMLERVRLAKGTLTIESKAMAGTTIHVRVPYRSEKSSQRAAG